MDVDIDLDIHIYISLLLVKLVVVLLLIIIAIIIVYYCYYYHCYYCYYCYYCYCMIDVEWITVGYPRNTSQKRLEIYWDIRPLSLSLSLLIYIRIYIYAYIDHYWIWLGHVTKKSWLSLHIDLGLSSTQGLPTVEGPLRDGGRLRSLEVSTDKPLHPNNITWHPLDSHASCFFGAAVTMLLWCRHKLQS